MKNCVGKLFFLFSFFFRMDGALSRKLHWQGMKLNHSLLTAIKFITSSVVRINFYILLFMCIFHNDLEFGAAGAFSSFNVEKRWNTISSTFSRKFYHARLAKWLPHKCFCCLLTVCFWLQIQFTFDQLWFKLVTKLGNWGSTCA